MAKKKTFKKRALTAFVFNKELTVTDFTWVQTIKTGCRILFNWVSRKRRKVESQLNLNWLFWFLANGFLLSVTSVTLMISYHIALCEADKQCHLCTNYCNYGRAGMSVSLPYCARLPISKSFRCHDVHCFGTPISKYSALPHAVHTCMAGVQ